MRQGGYSGGSAAVRRAAVAVYVTALVCVCRAELAVFLLMRVLKRKKDARFDDMRENFWVCARGPWLLVLCGGSVKLRLA